MRGYLILSTFLAVSPMMASAQSLDSAKAFVTRLYERYGRGEPDYAGKDASRTFSPRLVRLIRRDQDRTPEGDVGALDGDPICDCQDAGGLKLVNVDVQASGRDGAKAIAHIGFPNESPITIRLDLARIGGAWRVSDVHTKDMPSLVALLEHSER